jgi:dynein heavy chain
VFDSSVSFFNIIVPTADTYKFGYIINKLMSGGFNVLLTGETGVGKSIIMNEFLMKINPEKFVYSNLNFSAQTSS